MTPLRLGQCVKQQKLTDTEVITGYHIPTLDALSALKTKEGFSLSCNHSALRALCWMKLHPVYSRLPGIRVHYFFSKFLGCLMLLHLWKEDHTVGRLPISLYLTVLC